MFTRMHVGLIVLHVTCVLLMFVVAACIQTLALLTGVFLWLIAAACDLVTCLFTHTPV